MLGTRKKLLKNKRRKSGGAEALPFLSVWRKAGLCFHFPCETLDRKNNWFYNKDKFNSLFQGEVKSLTGGDQLGAGSPRTPDRSRFGAIPKPTV